MPTISVVIPLYNKGPHILRTLASVAAQTLAPDEIIVVDDGSTDGGYEAVQALEMPGLQLHRRPTPGAAGSAARNLGTTVAKGEWIALLDADDEWMPNHLEVCVATLKRTNAPDGVAAVFSGYRNIHPDGRQDLDRFSRRYLDKSPGALTLSDLISIWLEIGKSPLWTSAVMVRRQSLIDAGLFPAERCTRGEDKDTWLRVARVGTCLPTNQITAIYHRDAVNRTTSLKYANQEPCIRCSIVAMLAESNVEEAQKLRRLSNLELYNYAVATTKVEPLKRRTWEGFYSDIDPVRALVLNVLSVPAVSALLRRAVSLRLIGVRNDS